MKPAMAPLLATVIAAALLTSGCGTGGDEVAPSAAAGAFGSAPATPDGELEPEVGAATDDLIDGALDGVPNAEALAVVAESGDPRLGWVLSDLLRFSADSEAEQELVDAFAELTGVDTREASSSQGGGWLAVTDHLIAWDLPAPPEYRERKGRLFTALEPGWEPFFADADAEIDWRLLSWGGVLIDDRPLGDPGTCEGGCIPSLDDPELTDAEAGDWYDDSEAVFGVVVGGEAVAFRGTSWRSTRWSTSRSAIGGSGSPTAPCAARRRRTSSTRSHPASSSRSCAPRGCSRARTR